MSERRISRLERWRNHSGISVETMAHLLGESVDDYLALEAGKNADPLVRACLSIAFADRIPVRALLGRITADNEDALYDSMTEAFNITLANFERGYRTNGVTH